MATGAAAIKVIISGDAKGALRAFDEARGGAEKTGLSFGKLAAGVGAGIAVIAAGAVAVGTVLVKAGDQLNEAQDQLNNSLKNQHQNIATSNALVDASVTKFQRLGITQKDLTVGVTGFVNIGQTAAQALHDMSVSADLAAGRHISLAAAESIVTKVQTGHVALLGRYGIATKDANGKTISSAEAMKRLAKIYGGDAQTATKSLAGQTQVLHAWLQNTEAHIGQKLIPILTKFALWLSSVVFPAIANLVKWVQVNWPKLEAAIEPVLKTISGYISGFVSTVEHVWQQFGGRIVSFAQKAWGSIKTYISGELQVIQSVFRLFADVLTGKWGKLWGDILGIFRGLWKMVKGEIGFAWTEITSIATLAWAGIKNVTSDAVGKIVSWVTGIPGKLGDLGSALLQKGKDLIQGLIDGIRSMAGDLAGAAKSVFDKIPGVSLLKKVPGLGFLAGGGQAIAGRPYVVGEQGPELFIPGHTGTVIPNGVGGGSSTVIMNFPAGAAPAAVNAAQVRWNKRNGKAQ